MQALQIGLLVCVIGIGYGIFALAGMVQRVARRLESPGAVLTEEFSKEKNYHRQKNKSDEMFEESKKATLLYPVEMLVPPRAPAIVSIAESLVELTSYLHNLRRLAEACDKLAGINREE